MQILISYNHMWRLQENDDNKPRADIFDIFLYRLARETDKVWYGI